MRSLTEQWTNKRYLFPYTMATDKYIPFANAHPLTAQLSSGQCCALDTNLDRWLLSGNEQRGLSIFDTLTQYESWQWSTSDSSLPPLSCVTNVMYQSSAVTSVLWYPHDPGLFLSGHDNSELVIWDTVTAEAVSQIRLGTAVIAMSMSSVASAVASSLVAVASAKEPFIRLCDLRSAVCTHQLAIRPAQKDASLSVDPLCLTWSSNQGTLLYASGKDAALRIWDIRQTKKPLSVQLNDKLKRAVHHLGWHPEQSDRYLMAWSPTARRLVQWDTLGSASSLLSLPASDRATLPASIVPAPFASTKSSSRCTAFFMGSGSQIYLIDGNNGQLRHVTTLKGHIGSVTALAVHPVLPIAWSMAKDHSLLTWTTRHNSQTLQETDQWSDEDDSIANTRF